MRFEPRRYFATAAADLRRHAADIGKLGAPDDQRAPAAAALIEDAARLLDELAEGRPSSVRRAPR